MKYNLCDGPRQKAYMQLYREVREDIIRGIYKYGQKLPSKRQLADRTGVSVITVEHAYDLLMEEGYIDPKERSGYFVVYKKSDAYPVAPVVREKMIFPREERNQEKEEVFPFPVFPKTVRTVLSRWGEKLLRASPHAGMPELREILSEYLARSRGISALPEQIFIGAGAEYLYSLVVQMIGRKKIVALEDPCYDMIKKVYRAQGILTDPLPMGKDGIRTEALEKTEAKVLHVTPFHSYPSGITAPASKRHEYVAWAESGNLLVIEDDFDSEFTLLSKPEDTLYSLSSKGHVIYMNTFSKTIAPSLRMGYVVIPPDKLEEFKNKAGFYSCTVPVLDQLVLAECIGDGHFERHINRIRRKRRREIKKKS